MYVCEGGRRVRVYARRWVCCGVMSHLDLDRRPPRQHAPAPRGPLRLGGGPGRP